MEVTLDCGCKLLFEKKKIVPCSPEHYALNEFIIFRLNELGLLNPARFSNKPQVNRLRPLTQE